MVPLLLFFCPDGLHHPDAVQNRHLDIHQDEDETVFPPGSHPLPAIVGGYYRRAGLLRESDIIIIFTLSSSATSARGGPPFLADVVVSPLRRVYGSVRMYLIVNDS